MVKNIPIPLESYTKTKMEFEKMAPAQHFFGVWDKGYIFTEINLCNAY